MFEGFLSRWLLCVIVHLIVFQSSYVLRDRSEERILGGLYNERKISGRGPAKRLVLAFLEGLRLDTYNQKASHHRLYGLSTSAACRSSTADPLLGLKEVLTGVPGVLLDDDVESVLSHSRSVFVGPPSVAATLGSGVEKVCFQQVWENRTVFPYPRKVDQWTVNAVQSLSMKNYSYSDPYIILIYFQGIDVYNNIYGPDSSYSAGELINAMDSFNLIYNNLEKVFNDSKTGYILTGLHGGSNSYDVMNVSNARLPIVTWGAGFCKKDDRSKSESHWYRKMGDMLNSDIASLISSVLGTKIPSNSLGNAPLYCLKDDAFRAKVSLNNAKHLVHLCGEFEKKLAYGWARYLSPLKPFLVHKLTRDSEDSFRRRDFGQSMDASQRLSQLSLDGIDHYKRFKRRNIAVCLVLTLLGWTAVTLGWVLKKAKRTPLIEEELLPQPQTPDETNPSETQQQSFTRVLCNPHVMLDIAGLIAFVGALAILVFFSAPFSVTTISLLTVFMVWLVSKQLFVWHKLYQISINSTFRGSPGKPLLHLIAFTIFILIFEYPILSNLVFLISITFSCLSDLRRKNKPYLSFWTLSSVPFFLLLHSDMGTPNFCAHVFCAFLWIAVTAMLSFFLKPCISDLPLLVAGSISTLFVVFCSQHKLFSTASAKFLCWSPLALISFVPLIGSSHLATRLLQISVCFCVNIAYFSLNVELLFLLPMLVHIFAWFLIEGFSSFDEFLAARVKFSPLDDPIDWSDARRCFYYIAYVITTFLCSGNSVEVSSWPKSIPSIFPLPDVLKPFCYVFLRAFPVAVLSNIPIVLLGRHCPLGYQTLKMFLCSVSSLFHFLLKSDYESNVCLQFIFLMSFLADQISSLLLTTSLFSRMIHSKHGVITLAMGKKEPTTAEVSL